MSPNSGSGALSDGVSYYHLRVESENFESQSLPSKAVQRPSGRVRRPVPWPLEPPLPSSTERIVRGIDGWTEPTHGEEHKMSHKTTTSRTQELAATGPAMLDGRRGTARTQELAATGPAMLDGREVCALTVEQRVAGAGLCVDPGWAKSQSL